MKEAFDLIQQRLRERYNDYYKVRVDYAEGLRDGYIGAMTIVSEVEAEYGNGWIDVKDRLPEKDGYYLTCDRKGNIHVFYHHPSYVTNGNNMAFGICKNHPQFYKPIAWMELPKRYNRLERK